MTFICSIISAIGVITVIAFIYRVITFAKVNYFTETDLKHKYAKAGNWAVVTGSTEGIGYAMAIDAARRGFNVALISRTKSKLDAVVAEIQKMGVSALAIEFDFAKAGDQEYEALFTRLKAIDIGLLINNVGVNYLYANYFDEASLDDDMRIIKVNCEATVRMTKCVVPLMKSKGAGGILFLGSFSALTPTPLLATYAGSKAFNVSFAQSLAYELGPHGIDVMVATPNLVVSKMTQGGRAQKPKESFVMVGAAPMARQTLNKLGAVTRTSGHVDHCIIEAALGFIPEAIVSKWVLDNLKSIKRRAERKTD